MKKLRINIDGREVTGVAGQTILEAARDHGVDIPTLCYDERTEIYGSCGLCVVEVAGNPKLVKACATPIAEGMEITTKSKRVIESRKTNLELLLSKHIGDCVAPCQLACPGQTDCQGYVGLIANGEYAAALELIKKKLPLPASIGRVCPHPCEKACRRGLVDEPVSILWLKRFAADLDIDAGMFMPEIGPDTGKSVGIIGGGPAGLTAAYFLRTLGHAVTIYEAMPKMGGMLRYGIPEYRLPKAVLDEEVALIEAMGATLVNNVRVGADIHFEEIRRGHDAVYVALGAWTSSGLRCDGVDAQGVVGGINLLRRVSAGEPFALGDRVAVVGGGNTAMDACRTAVRLGAKEVYNIYRRTVAEMPAEADEIKEAQEEGVIFKNLCNPAEIIADDEGRVKQMRLQIMELGEPDASGRRRPVPVEGKEELIDVDTVILAIGQGIDPTGMDGLELTKWNTVAADAHTFTTNLEGVFAGGDCINDGASIAIKAIGEAKQAVGFMDKYLKGDSVAYRAPYYVTRDDIDADYLEGRKKYKRPVMAHLAPEARCDNFEEIVKGYTPEQAKAEAARCLECGCHDYFECSLVDYANQYAVEPERFAGENKELIFEDDHPFIERNPNKCILCGRCVRACDEVVGISALGLVNRGFDTVVAPALGGKLADSGCIACGTCVSVCPTGALGERPRGYKGVPTDTTKTRTTCGYCGAGCQITVEAMGNTITKAVPAIEEGLTNEGVMCGRGRFGANQVQQGDRLTKPLVKNAEGVLEEADWYKAFVTIAKKAQTISGRFGQDALKAAISPRYTTEELATIAKFAAGLGADTFSFANRSRGEAAVLGENTGIHDFNALLSADVILSLGCTRSVNPVLRYKLTQAARRGAAIYAVNPVEDGMDRFADEFIVENDDLEFLAEIVKHVFAYRQAEGQGLAVLEQSLAQIEVSDEAAVVAEALLGAKNPVILMADKYVTKEASGLAADIAVLLGKAAGPRCGVMRIAAKNNSLGLEVLGITQGAQAAKDARGLLIFGEDPQIDLSGYDFVMVQDTHLTATAAQADVVLPALAAAEVGGTFINTEGRLQKVRAAVDKPLPYSNIGMIVAMAKILGMDLGPACGGKIRRGLKAQLPALKGVDIGGFITREAEDSDYCLVPYVEGSLFEEVPCTDALMNKISAELAAVVRK
ncbi:MAG: FAD-dependent oxidoreductase [Eubacterium sp.]|nr:FAD-dependent oxidoreductase [Eubacterium sp.]